MNPKETALKVRRRRDWSSASTRGRLVVQVAPSRNMQVPTERSLSNIRRREIPARAALRLERQDKRATEVVVEDAPQLIASNLRKPAGVEQRMEVRLARDCSGLESNVVGHRRTDSALQESAQPVERVANILLRGGPHLRANRKITELERTTEGSWSRIPPIRRNTFDAS